MKNRSKKWLLLLLVMAIAGICYFGKGLSRYYHDYKVDRDRMESLREQVIQTKPAKKEEREQIDDAVEENNGIVRSFDVDWNRLQEINPDIVAWIYLPALPQISYPILQGPDNQYYANRTYDLSSNTSKAGSIYLNCRAAADFSSAYSIIYGHNVRDGSMFSDLMLLLQPEYQKKDRSVWILTSERNIKYDIFSIFQCHRTADVFQKFYPDISEPYLIWKQTLKERNAVLLSDVSSVNAEEMIVLVTCVPDSYDRIAVCAQLTYESQADSSDERSKELQQREKRGDDSNQYR